MSVSQFLQTIFVVLSLINSTLNNCLIMTSAWLLTRPCPPLRLRKFIKRSKSSFIQPDKVEKADGQNNKICLPRAFFILQYKFTKKFQCYIILFPWWTVHSTLSFSHKEWKKVLNNLTNFLSLNQSQNYKDMQLHHVCAK